MIFTSRRFCDGFSFYVNDIITLTARSTLLRLTVVYVSAAGEI